MIKQIYEMHKHILQWYINMHYKGFVSETAANSWKHLLQNMESVW